MSLIRRLSWNKNLTYHRGNAMGGEFRAKGVNILLGPVVGPMFRIARGGRNWEGFSPDPYLSGALVALTVAGVQDRGVMASTKVQWLTCSTYGTLRSILM